MTISMLLNLPLILILTNLSIFIVSFTYLEIKNQYKSILLMKSFNWIMLLIFMWMTVFLILTPNINMFYFEFMIHQTKFSNLLVLFIMLNGLMWILTASSTCGITFNELFMLILFCFLSYLVLIYTNDLILIYMFLEMQSLVFYLFSGLKRTSEFSIEASLKYFIMGGTISFFLLLGFALFYGNYAMTNLNDLFFMLTLETYYNDMKLKTLMTAVFLSMVLHFKLNTAPMHLWSPSMYEAVNTLTFWHFMIFPKMISIFLMMKLSSIFNISWNNYTLWLVLSGMSALYIGGLNAYYQLKWKKFLMYSSIHHSGFLLLSLMKFTYINYFALVFYMVIYFLTLHGTLLIFLNMQTKQLYGFFFIRYLNNLNSLFSFNSSLTLVLTTWLFSFAGLPPFVGFMSKLLMIFSLVLNKFYLTSIFVIFMSFYVCYYYLSIIKQLWFTYNLIDQMYFIQVARFQANILMLVLLIFVFISYFPSSLNFFMEVWLLNLLYYV